MTARSLAAALAAAAVAALTVQAQNPAAPANPYQNTKVGDYASYKMKVSVGPVNLEGVTTQTVTARTDKEVTVKTTATVNGMEAPPQEQKIDLTKPYDPTKVGGLPMGTEATVTKGKDGAEKVKVGTKEYETTWTNYTVKAKAAGMDIDSDVKVWNAKDVPMGMVKMEMTAKVGTTDMKMSMELSEFGGGKKP